MDELHRALANAVRAAVKERFGLDPESIPLEKPKQAKLADLACPLPFELARQLKRPPRAIAAELAAGLGPVEGLARAEAAGGGYGNFHYDPATVYHGAVRASRAPVQAAPADAPQIIV